MSMVATLLLAAPLAAMADIGDKGSPDPLSAFEKFAYFIAIPVGLLVICVLIFMRPGSGGAARYRPQRGWEADDAWFGVTPPAQLPATPPAPVVGDGSVAAAEETGGSRGSW